MRYSEALEFLRGLQGAGLRPGLERVEGLARAAGNPERELRFIHVAGTNGKGSTCAFLESLYRRQGLRVGLYTSPHLRTFRERIQINRVPISEAEAGEGIGRLAASLRDAPAPQRPSFFEFTTVLALDWFRRCACDVVIWETGMGGRRDATNLVMPLASVITNVGWDHAQWLGNSLGAIAEEKAGIIKPSVPVLTAAEIPEVLQVVRDAAAAAQAPLRIVEPSGPEVEAVRNSGVGLHGCHQATNAALAVATAEVLRDQIPFDPNESSAALRETRWPGRFQVVESPTGLLILDVAHNEPAFRALARALQDRFPGQRFAVVLGLFPDKDPRAVMETLLRNATRTLVVPLGPRRTEADALASQLKALGAAVERADDFRHALARLTAEPRVVVAGSFQLVGEALDVVSGQPESGSERWLNEWRPAPNPPPSA